MGSSIPAAPPTTDPAASVTLPPGFLSELIDRVIAAEKAAASDVAHGSLAGAAQEVGSVFKAAAADVKAINWSHVASFVMAAAALALHFVHLPL